MSEILGFNPIIVAVFATVIGVAGKIILGWANSKEPFQIKKTVSTMISGVITGLSVVMASLSNISDTASDQTIFLIILGSVSSVMGIDYALRTGTKLSKKTA